MKKKFILLYILVYCISSLFHMYT